MRVRSVCGFVVVGVVVLALPVITGGGSGRVASAGTPGNGLIAFARSDPAGVYVMRPNGSGIRALVRLGKKASYGDLAWSPDGRKLAFRCWLPPQTEPQLCLTRVEGGAVERLVIGGGLLGASSPTWSPDGRRIAFTGGDRPGGRDIYVTDVDGSNLRRLVKTPRLWEVDVAWAPVGGRIAFSAGGYVPFVYVMNADGSGRHKLVLEPTYSALEPAWSPDGRRIVLTRWKGASQGADLYALDAKGGTPVRLTRNRVPDRNAVWSPDGRRIAFVSAPPDEGPPWKNGIYVMNADGSGRTRLTHGGSPAWQPIPQAP